MGVRQRNVCSHEDLQPLISPNTSVGCVCEGSITKVAKRDGRVFGHRTGGRQLLERRGISGSVWSWGGVLLVLGAILTATDVAGQTPKLLENNGGHFRFGNIRWEKLEGNKVQFTIESAWRRDYSSAYWKGLGDDGLTVVGDVIHLNGRQWPVFNYGDDSVTAGEYLKLQVMAYSKLKTGCLASLSSRTRMRHPTTKVRRGWPPSQAAASFQKSTTSNTRMRPGYSRQASTC